MCRIPIVVERNARLYFRPLLREIAHGREHLPSKGREGSVTTEWVPRAQNIGADGATHLLPAAGHRKFLDVLGVVAADED